MHGFPTWILLMIEWWPLILGVLVGVIGQIIWKAWF